MKNNEIYIEKVKLYDDIFRRLPKTPVRIYFTLSFIWAMT